MKRIILILLLIMPFVLAQKTFCDGCLYEDICVERGVQYSGFYCDENNTIVGVKAAGSPCSYNYECSSFYCDKVCKVNVKEGRSIWPLFLIIIVLFFSIYLLFKKFSPLSKEPEEKKSFKELLRR